MYVSNLRINPTTPLATQPSWQTVNKREDSFNHAADPASLTLRPSSGAVTLSWQPDGRSGYGFGIIGYVVYAGPSPANLSQVATLMPASNSYTVTGLSDGSKYYFEVHTLLNGNDSPYSWTESASAGNPITPVIYDPSYTVSAQPSPGAVVVLTVTVKTAGPAPSSLQLETEVHPVTWPSFTMPTSWPMYPIGGGSYQGTATVSMPLYWYGGIAYRVVDSGSGAAAPDASRGTGFYVTNPNNRLHFGKYPDNWMMDPASPAWRSILSSYVNYLSTTAPYGGVLLDDVVAVIGQAQPDAYPAGYSDAS